MMMLMIDDVCFFSYNCFCSYDDFFIYVLIFLFRLLVDIDFRLVHFITDFRLVDQFSAFYVCCILG